LSGAVGACGGECHGSVGHKEAAAHRIDRGSHAVEHQSQLGSRTPATLGNSGAMWHNLAGDQQIRSGAAPARPRAATPCARPDRPGVRAAAGRRGARPRRAHVGRALQPPVPARLRRVAVQLPHDAAHRARDGAAASWRPQRHRGLFRGRLLVAGHLQHSLQRTGRYAAKRLPAPRGACDRRDAVVRGETGDQTDQESRSAGPEPQLEAAHVATEAGASTWQSRALVCA
jgi:hypothetical protein